MKTNTRFQDWMKYVVFNDPNYDYRDIDLKAIAKAQTQDPGNISTFNGDLSAFHARGGKLISYHGLSDPVRFYLPSTIYSLLTR